MDSLDLIFDPISFAIGAVASALISIFIGFFIKRPRLRVSGGGGGNVLDGTKRNYLRVENELAWFGFNIPETKILGFRLILHGSGACLMKDGPRLTVARCSTWNQKWKPLGSFGGCVMMERSQILQKFDQELERR